MGRGGNLSVLVYVDRPLEDLALSELRAALDPFKAVVEVPPARRVAVATVPVRAGFQRVEAAIARWMRGRDGVEWFYGNVYDDAGDPLLWWEESGLTTA